MNDEHTRTSDEPTGAGPRAEAAAPNSGAAAPEPAGDSEVVDAEVVDAAGDGSETVADEGDLISAELTAAQAEADEYRDTLQRLKAEFDNYKKRVVREQTALVERASGQLIRDLLPVLDAFEAALATAPGADDTALRTGLEKVWDQMTTILGSAGLDRIADTGVVFDPQRHEAVMSEGPVATGGPTVEEVFRSGWALKGAVLRPAMVKVRG
jgi:molecular chaperone GrpE